MRVMKVDVKGLQVSFRRPLDLNFQRTLPLPPPTTILGLAAAAIGISDLDLWKSEKWRSLREMKVSVLMNRPPGKAKDMMKVLKVKNGKIEERSPYFRELLFDVEYSLLYAGEEDLIERLKQAFVDPFYALSLGREDELIEVMDIMEVDLIPGEPVFYGTVIPGDIRNMNVELPGLQSLSLSRIEPAVIESVPLGFKVKENLREALRKRTLTFLPYSLQLRIRERKWPIYQINGRNFTWLNF